VGWQVNSPGSFLGPLLLRVAEIPPLPAEAVPLRCLGITLAQHPQVLNYVGVPSAQHRTTARTKYELLLASGSTVRPYQLPFCHVVAPVSGSILGRRSDKMICFDFTALNQ